MICAHFMLVCLSDSFYSEREKRLCLYCQFQISEFDIGLPDKYYYLPNISLGIVLSVRQISKSRIHLTYLLKNNVVVSFSVLELLILISSKSQIREVFIRYLVWIYLFCFGYKPARVTKLGDSFLGLLPVTTGRGGMCRSLEEFAPDMNGDQDISIQSTWLLNYTTIAHSLRHT